MAEGTKKTTTTSPRKGASAPSPARAPAKATPKAAPKAPAKKKAKPSAEGTAKKIIKGADNTSTWKLTPAAVQFILDMTVSGYSNSEILKALKEQFNVKVSENILAYHRNKNADKLAQSYQAELDTARARSGLSFLSRRIAIADELITKEAKKSKPSLYGVATLLSAADTAIHRAEQRRMKYEELARRYKEGGDDQKQEILAALERRTALINELNRVEEEMLGIVDADFTVVAPRQLESTAARPVPEPAAQEAEEAEGEEEDDGIGENALLA